MNQLTISLLVSAGLALGCSGPNGSSQPEGEDASGKVDGNGNMMGEEPDTETGAGGGAVASAGGTPGIATGGETAGSGGASPATGGNGSGGTPPVQEPRAVKRVLAYNRVDVHPTTMKLRGHTGSGADEELLEELGEEHGFEVIVTDDPAAFTQENLAEFEVLVFASPHYAGQIISNEGRDAIEAFVRGGGGFIGFHYALKVETNWAFRKELGGGVNIGPHGRVEPATYSLSAAAHPVTDGMPQTFSVSDDYLTILGDLGEQEHVTILATAELTEDPGGHYPTIWSHEIDDGRVVYSMPGHGAAPFRADWYKTLVWSALRWTAKVEAPE